MIYSNSTYTFIIIVVFSWYDLLPICLQQHDSLLDDENSQQLLKLVKQTSVKISAPGEH